ncbi:hypothetical protein NDS46_12335 [Paenibacillus thiaminolyticus]|uniref:hypothetical protein n=1 Tax=Paenibacillus thiaminolyticus TaxID=49283 RepID=UPI00232FE4BF|nr:hypothetical protein [Paenibacillus thiaminolyticus]WCF10576.1 hypothetical protein NDS46_12335 [Paenibacillus thiaminolyticus]
MFAGFRATLIGREENPAFLQLHSSIYLPPKVERYQVCVIRDGLTQHPHFIQWIAILLINLRASLSKIIVEGSQQ